MDASAKIFWVIIALSIIISAIDAKSFFQKQTEDSEITPIRYKQKIRSIRGFRAEKMSNARGFGKRNLAPTIDFFNLEENIQTQSFPTKWIASQIQKQKDMAEMFVKKYMDLNGDGLVTKDELMMNGRLKENNELEQY